MPAISRRDFTAGAVGATLLLAGCWAPGGDESGKTIGPVPDKPGSAVQLSILDVAGNLQLTRGMIDDFVAGNPGVVSEVSYASATAPELAGKIKAQQNARQLDIDLVLTGVDGLAAGIEQGLWTQLLPAYAARLPGMRDYLPGAAAMQQLAGDFGVTITYYPSGPLIEYLPEQVPHPPLTAPRLLGYAAANPGAVQYARPANSGPGRTLLMGLPYLLGDANPKDPLNGWNRTWAYLSELNKSIPFYPAGTGETMRNLAAGTVKIIASTTGWDINPRVLGTVPKQAVTGTLSGFHWVTDAHYAVLPKGVWPGKQAAVLLLLQHLLTKDQQAKTYDKGYFYPGPAVKDVDLAMAPPESRLAIAEFGRPQYPDLIARHPLEVPLGAKELIAAFDRWDRQIGAGKTAK